MSTSKTCPICGLYNPATAVRCDCGYDFNTRAVQKSYLRGKRDREALEVHLRQRKAEASPLADPEAMAKARRAVERGATLVMLQGVLFVAVSFMLVVMGAIPPPSTIEWVAHAAVGIFFFVSGYVAHRGSLVGMGAGAGVFIAACAVRLIAGSDVQRLVTVFLFLVFGIPILNGLRALVAMRRTGRTELPRST